MNSAKVRIISDGMANGTQVLDGNGDRLKLGSSGITKIEIEPIEPGKMVRATITIENIMLDLDAQTGTKP